jgi:two-component system chemotaxis response regulator CheY
MRLMVVDDSNMIRTRISRIIQSGDMKGISLVGLARNGAEAIRVARTARPELVTMDLTMPEMDGIECIAELLRMWPDTHILVISALSDKATAIAALKLGAKGFLPKPFSDQDLKLALLDVMESR